MQQEDILRKKLASMRDSGGRGVAKTANKGLQYAKHFEGADRRDILRHYIKKAEESKDPSIQKRTEISYEGRVFERSSYDGGFVTGYTIVDCESVNAEKVSAKLVDVNTMEAEMVNCTVLDAKKVVCDDMTAQIEDYITHKTIEQKEENKEAIEENKKKQDKKKRGNFEDISDELEDSKERQVAKSMIKNAGMDEQEDVKELLTSDKSPIRMLRSVAQEFSRQYNRPPKKPGEDLVEAESNHMTVYVSDTEPNQDEGYNIYNGQWVIIEYNNKATRIEIIYKQDGIAGEPDKEEVRSLEETSRKEIKKITNQFLDTE